VRYDKKKKTSKTKQAKMVDEEGTPQKTPLKTYAFLSPRGFDVCLLCQKDILIKNKKVNLWNAESLTSAGHSLENLLSVSLIKSTDFPAICRNCWRQIQTLEERVNKFKNLVEDGRKISETFVRVRTKRGKVNDEPKTRKKLVYLHHPESSGEMVRIFVLT